MRRCLGEKVDVAGKWCYEMGAESLEDLGETQGFGDTMDFVMEFAMALEPLPPIKKAKLSLLKSLKDVREPLSQEKTIEALVADEDFSNEHLDRLATSSESESSDSDDDEDRRRFELLKVVRNVFSRVGLVLWLLGFTAFYAYSAFDGSWAKGFYWTVQAGLSIGFGVLTEKSALNLWATVLNICLGAGLAGVVLSSTTTTTKVRFANCSWIL